MHLARCGCELDPDEEVCASCRQCEVCCECDDALFDADELGLDPENDDQRRYHEEVE